MPDYLLEVGTEELPANQVPESQERLKCLLADALRESNVKFDDIVTMGTPRRLTCIVRGIAAVQDTVTKKVAGPAVKSSFDASGKPTPAAAGFAQKHGLLVEDLSRETIAGVEKLVANVTIEGRPVSHVLQEIVPISVLALSGERPMRWGACELKFSRPIRWIVSLLDSEEVPVAIDSIKSGRESYGNRVLSPGRVKIESTRTYAENLKEARVLACPEEREATIKQQVAAIATNVSGNATQLGGSLLDEVVNITEWPHAILGEFEHEYLDLPDRLIETIMIHHQRYFPVERKDVAVNAKQKLLPYFITVSNNDRIEAAPQIKQGNERVIRARLADGRFFYFDDQKTKLADRKPALAQLTFQKGLGTYMDKTERLVHTARILIDSMNLDSRVAICLERTMELCKLDLVSNLVRELPELQGYVGSWYAEKEQQPPDVVTAISSHYAPRSQSDSIPPDTVGQFAALIDKLDNLVAYFAIGLKPSGSSDPYALRRQAQGVVDILFDGLKTYTVNVTALIELLLTLIQPMLAGKKGFDSKRTVEEVREFLILRVKTKLQERAFKREIVDAVLSACDPLENLQDVIVRCQILQDLLVKPAGLDLIRAGVRIGNILKPDSPGSVNADLFTLDAEKELWQAFQMHVIAIWEKQGHFKRPQTADEYNAVLQLLSSIVEPVDVFFEKVMVNDPDTVKRNNRHGMLNLLSHYFSALADFTKLQPLLP